MHARDSEIDVGRSPLVLHMTRRRNDGIGSSPVNIEICRSVEVTLPPTTDADESKATNEVRNHLRFVLCDADAYGS